MKHKINWKIYKKSCWQKINEWDIIRKLSLTRVRQATDLWKLSRKKKTKTTSIKFKKKFKPENNGQEIKKQKNK